MSKLRVTDLICAEFRAPEGPAAVGTINRRGERVLAVRPPSHFKVEVVLECLKIDVS